jgi:SAM-dependent methyltransferase
MSSPFQDFLYPIHKFLEDTAKKHMARLSGTVLDLGCGMSPYQRFLPDNVTYLGVDRLVRGKVQVRCAAESLPFQEKSFDSVVCTEMLELSPRPWQVIAEISRVLKPGGYVYITWPFDWHMHFEPHDYFRVTPYGMRSLLESNGFEVEELESVGGVFTSFVSKLIENVVCDWWLPATQKLGVKRGAYRAAAMLFLPVNLFMYTAGPLFDKASPRNPFCVAALARKKNS